MYLKLLEGKDYTKAFYYMFLMRRELSNTEKTEYPEWEKFVSDKRVCSVCLTSPPFEKAVITPCFHLFCRKCLDTWMIENLTCPMCRCHVCEYDRPIITLNREGRKVYRNCIIPAPECRRLWKMQSFYFRMVNSYRNMATLLDFQ